MRKRAQPAPADLAAHQEPRLDPAALTAELEFVSLDKIPAAKNEATISLYKNLRTRHWQAAAVYIAGGVCFTTLLTIAFYLSSDIEISPLDFIYTALIHFWPTILVLSWVALLESRSNRLVVAAYCSIWLVITAMGISLNPAFTWGKSILGWLIFNLLPTTVVIMFLYRRIRAVGPLVFTFLTFGLSGLHLFYNAATAMLESALTGEGPTYMLISTLFNLGLGTYAVLALILILSILLMAAIGWLTLQLLKWLYLHKRQSGQSLVIDPIWLIFGYLTSALMVFESPWWILAGPVAFIFYKFVTWTGFAILNRRRRKTKGLELLLLRVFSLGKRSEQLYNLIARAWRYVGDIRFITGPDLATATVEPHNFLDYLSGRLRHHFIDSAETLERRIRNLDVFPGLDGRYRIHDFFCYDDTWKMVLSRLASDSNVILMDLRKFSRSNAGCAFEIHELVEQVPLQRVVFVIDKTTDEAFLRESIENALKGLTRASPNRRNCTEIGLFHYEETGSGSFYQLLAALSVAATASQ
jgi:hypothetical protein